MSLTARVVLKWADGSYSFRLTVECIEELQKVCGAKFGEIAKRVFADAFDIRDVVHTIRLGLQGDGMAPVKAKEMVDFYVGTRPLAPPGDESSSLAVARAVLAAVYFGIEDLPEVGEQVAGAATTSSTSRPSVPSSSISGSRPMQ